MEGGSSIQNEGGSDNYSQSSDEEQQSGCVYQCCDPRGKCHRFIALIFLCLLGFGSYFCYDNPAALENDFENDLKISPAKFVGFYSVYSWPNVVFCFIGGFLMDRVFGIRLGTSIYMALTLVGQLLFAFGAFYNSYWTMIAARFIFGIGAESLAVAQNSYAVLWFKGKELNMVFGLQLSFARIGSAANFWVMQPVYDAVNKEYHGYQALGIALFIATFTCIGSMLVALIMGCLDKRAERILRRNELVSDEIVSLKDVKDFSAPFWLIGVICVAYYVAIFPFIALGKKFFITKFHMDPQAANTLNSLVYSMSAFCSPAFGFIIDKCGKNLVFVLLSIVGTIVAHSLLGFTEITPYVGMVLMGMSYSILASSLWPLVSLIVPDYQLGTAYGILQAIQNLGLAVISIVTGQIVDHSGYFWLEVFFIGNLAVAFIACVVVWIVDYVKNGPLNLTPNAREVRQQTLIASDIIERNRLLAGASTSTDTLQPSTDFQIRNRYLSRIGAPLPAHYCLTSKCLKYRTMR